MKVTFTYQPTEQQIKKVMEIYQIERSDIRVANGMKKATKLILNDLREWK